MKTYKSLPGIGPRRRALGLSMADAAAAVGATRQAWYYWEAGQQMPSAAYLPAIAETLHCRIEELYEEP